MPTPVCPRNRLEKLAEVGLRLLHGLAIVGVAGDRPTRRPAVDENRTVEFQVVGNLRRTKQRVLEGRVVAVDEDERVLLGPGSRQRRLDLGELRVVGLDRLQREVLLGVLFLIVETDAHIRHLDGPGAFDLGAHVRARDCDLRLTPGQRAAALGTVIAAGGQRLAIGPVEDRDHVEVARTGSAAGRSGRAASAQRAELGDRDRAERRLRKRAQIVLDQLGIPARTYERPEPLLERLHLARRAGCGLGRLASSRT